MVIEETLTLWIQGLRAGDERPARILWERYFDRLVALADHRLPRAVRRDFDEEDVAVSAIDSLCRALRGGRYPDLRDPSELWPLLVVITARKVGRRLRARSAQKQGGGQTRGESVFRQAGSGEGGDESAAGICGIIGKEPTPDMALAMVEESERLLLFLEDDSLRELATLKMEGYSNETIAARFDCAVRTVERRLALIRRLWIEHPSVEGDRG